MSGPIVDFDEIKYRQEAYSAGQEVVIEELSAEKVPIFLAFLAEHFKGDWNAAARQKLGSGRLNEILIALLDNQVVGYCQWEGEHFGPFGVRADIRSKKIGAKLFVEAVVRIRQANGRNVWFNWADEGAARFYQRFGLEETRKFAILKKDF
jgi:GNAT superfamily N-acetyltransferase